MTASARVSGSSVPHMLRYCSVTLYILDLTRFWLVRPNFILIERGVFLSFELNHLVLALFTVRSIARLPVKGFLILGWSDVRPRVSVEDCDLVNTMVALICIRREINFVDDRWSFEYVCVRSAKKLSNLSVPVL